MNIYNSMFDLLMFFNRFGKLSKDFVFVYEKGKTLTRAEKEDWRDFREDAPAFKKYIDFHKSFETEFKKAVKKGKVQEQIYKEWKKCLYNAELSLLACEFALNKNVSAKH